MRLVLDASVAIASMRPAEPGLTLCTLDQEMAQRGAVFCKVIAP
jgi:hypothetical protein